MNPTPEGEMQNQSIEDAISEAEAAEDAGDLDGALAVYARAIAAYPDSPDLHYLRGRCLFGLDRYPEAIADLTRALALQPRFLSAFMFRALARYATGDHRGAIADNTAALTFADIEPDVVARLYYARAMSHEALGEAEEAEQDFDAARRYDPDGENDPRGE